MWGLHTDDTASYLAPIQPHGDLLGFCVLKIYECHTFETFLFERHTHLNNFAVCFLEMCSDLSLSRLVRQLIDVHSILRLCRIMLGGSKNNGKPCPQKELMLPCTLFVGMHIVRLLTALYPCWRSYLRRHSPILAPERHNRVTSIRSLIKESIF